MKEIIASKSFQVCAGKISEEAKCFGKNCKCDRIIHLTFESYDCTLWQFPFLEDLYQGLCRAKGVKIRHHH